MQMRPLRLPRVPGLVGRTNDALFVAAAAPPADTLLYFGGDVQDYAEVMATHRENKNYVQWSLERAALQLAAHFPRHHILVVRPARVEMKSFSCYDNFVPSNRAGVPDHTATHRALAHLERLLQNVSTRLNQMSEAELSEAVTQREPAHGDEHLQDLSKASSEKEQDTPGGPLWWRGQLALERGWLALAGFSKGCVVLNQLLYEFHYTHTLTPSDQHTMRFIERIKALYWLDGGHAGGKNTWITARSLLETLARLDVEIYVHVSPYQVCDEARPWIAREEKQFTSMLTKLGAKIRRYLHEGSAPYTLYTHFSVLDNFKRIQDAHAHKNSEDT